MNVFRKISTSTTSIFHTQKKQSNINKSKIPQSAQKLAAKQQQCFYLMDYQNRGNGLLICRLTKDHNLMKKIGWRKLKSQFIQCTIKSNNKSQELWVGKQYWFVNMKSLEVDQNMDEGYCDITDNRQQVKSGKFIADKAILINQGTTGKYNKLH